jgi:hypothetical protein
MAPPHETLEFGDEGLSAAMADAMAAPSDPRYPVTKRTLSPPARGSLPAEVAFKTGLDHENWRSRSLHRLFSSSDHL